MTTKEFNHIPVLLNETLLGLNINQEGIYLDCTLGGGGHSYEIAKRLNNKGILLAVDKDIEAINAGKKRLQAFDNIRYFNDDFKNVNFFLENENISSLDGVLIDLGVSSHQIDSEDRGFSYTKDSPLDMRMNTSQNFSAYDVVNFYSYEKLCEIFYKYGEEEFSRSIAKNIVRAREVFPIETTKQLTAIIEKSMPTKIVYSRGGASKKVFQAIRIEVNGELEGLKELIEYLISKLKIGGRIAVISFHSLEDRITKNVFRDLSLTCTCPTYFPKCVCETKASIKIINKKPIVATEDEKKINSRSSCAKLRVAEKI